MPFESKAQRRWMHATHPEMAKRWEAETPKGKLPERVAKKAPHKRMTYKRVVEGQKR